MEIDLMAPRIKMIAPIPLVFSCGIEVNQVWVAEDGFYNLTGAHRIGVKEIEKYPHLFQPLPWWSDRKVEEMPEFISYISLGLMDKYNGDKSKAKIIIKIESWSVCEENGKWFFNDNEFNTIHHYHFPATLADYEAFISTTKK